MQYYLVLFFLKSERPLTIIPELIKRRHPKDTIYDQAACTIPKVEHTPGIQDLISISPFIGCETVDKELSEFQFSLLIC